MNIAYTRSVYWRWKTVINKEATLETVRHTIADYKPSGHLVTLQVIVRTIIIVKT